MINKILILGEVRSGSTNLGLSLSKFFNIPFFNEIINEKNWNEKPLIKNDKWIHKILVNTFHKNSNNISNDYCEYLNSISDLTIILSRKNIKEQFESFLRLRINQKKKIPIHGKYILESFDEWFDTTEKNEMYDILLNGKEIINTLELSLNLKKIFYENLYNEEIKITKKTLREINLPDNENQLIDQFNIKNKYKIVKRKMI